jgi:sugar phosphate isomerase/epimerase
MTGLRALDVPTGLPARLATPAPGDPRLARLSFNQRTVPRWSVPEAVDACVRAGVPAIGLWREPVAERGLAAAGRDVRSAGLRVSSLCRGGFLTAPQGPARRRAIDDNRRAIDEAAALGAKCLVLVVGGLPEGSRDLPAARTNVLDGVAELVPHAAACGVRLALEPMHPVYAADRGVLSTLEQALDWAGPFPPERVGVAIDTFHLWWDPRLDVGLTRAAGRIACYQVSDWVVPLAPDVLLARGMVGDGCIDLRHFAAAVAQAGFDGDVEVEIFNQRIWDAPPQDAFDTVLRRYVELALPPAVIKQE